MSRDSGSNGRSTLKGRREGFQTGLRPQCRCRNTHGGSSRCRCDLGEAIQCKKSGYGMRSRRTGKTSGRYLQ